MNIFTITLSILLTIFSTTVLAYISMATMIGPWIAPTIVLIAGLAFKLKFYSPPITKRNQELALIQTVGSIGGIVATAVGFTLPTLYFLDKQGFENLLASPLLFCSLIGITILGAGSLGILLGQAFKHRFLIQDNLPFPVSHVIHKTITSQTQSNQAKRMIVGFSATGLLGFLRDGLNLIPKNIYLFPSLFNQQFPITIMPTLWAIGFITGTSIALPLLVGMLSKYLILHPVNCHSLYLPFKLFPVLSETQFTMAFCSGLILAQVLPSLLKYPAIIWNSIKHHSGYSYLHRFKSCKTLIKKFIVAPAKPLKNFEAFFSIIITTALFTYLQFPLVALPLIILLTIIAAYNISYIAGEIGFAQIGRFTTFVMIPTMLLFKLSPLQITMLCVFVSSCITTSTDLLFDYKIGELCNLTSDQIRRYQWLGLIVTALCLGFGLWLLLTNLQLGTAELFAQRGKARALLIQSFSFNWTVVGLGFGYGSLLKKLKINPTMVFGGILMPNGLTIGLLIGAVTTYFTKERKDHFSLFSGVFVAESLLIILSILIKNLFF